MADLCVDGSANLVQTFIKHDLVDAFWLAYSYFKHTIGFTLVARNDGMNVAAIAVTATTMPTRIKVTGSFALTPCNRLPITRARASVPATPRAMPVKINRPPCRRTMERTCCLPAPMAMRMPISRVRCATDHESTP